VKHFRGRILPIGALAVNGIDVKSSGSLWAQGVYWPQNSDYEEKID
jgi:hypothetical protein